MAVVKTVVYCEGKFKFSWVTFKDPTWLNAGAATPRCSSKYVFLKISWYPQEKDLQWKIRDSKTGVSL